LKPEKVGFLEITKINLKNYQRKDVQSKLYNNRSIHKRAKRIYLKILNLIHKDCPKHIKLIKENVSFFADDREKPFKDFYRKWDKTFF
jgi:hypothetical protein